MQKNKYDKAAWREKQRCYREYLHSPEWNERRLEAFIAAGGKCAICGCGSDLHTHHLTYERIFNERPEDLYVVCKGCHKKLHKSLRKKKKRKKKHPKWKRSEKCKNA